MSSKGPSGRGVVSGSLQPRNTRTRLSRSPMNRSITVVLPTPASPRSNTRLPAPHDSPAGAWPVQFGKHADHALAAASRGLRSPASITCSLDRLK